jgi:hypothetical protein
MITHQSTLFSESEAKQLMAIFATDDVHTYAVRQSGNFEYAVRLENRKDGMVCELVRNGAMQWRFKEDVGTGKFVESMVF